MTPAAPRYLSAAASDQGLVRDNNEDRVYCDDVRGFFVVVDGMGGHEAGEQAAEIAVERLRGRLERQTGTAEQRLREAITLANNAIYQAAQTTAVWRGMSCVLTAAVIEDGQVTIGHVGDSRLYRIKRDQIEKITRDHSPVGEREDRGELSEAEAMRHPRRNEVYRDVGSEERTPEDEEFIEIRKIRFEPDSALLLCSDGLSDAISSKEVLRIVEQNAGDRWATVHGLIAAANAVGNDNVSAVFVEGEDFAASLGKSPVRRRAPIVTDPPAASERTGRTAAPIAKSPWHASRPAFLLYGAFAGVLVGLAIQAVMAPKPAVRLRQPIVVTPPGTIAAAVERAQPGDTVSVAPGTYSEAVRLKDGVQLIAQRAYEAIITGSVTADRVQGARLEGFRILPNDAVIRINDSDVVLSRDDITAARGTAIEFTGSSRGAMFGCLIHNNTGAGIVISDSASPAIENNVIVSNGTDAKASRPGLFVRSTARPYIAGNTFAANGAEAAWAPAADDALLQRNYFPGADKRRKFRIIPLGEALP
jgi:parallel beta-helix repeat protein